VVTAAAPDQRFACDWTAHLHRPTSTKSDSPRLQGHGVIPNRWLNWIHAGVYRGDETRRDEHHQPDDPEPKQRHTSKSDHHQHEPQDQ